METLITIIVSVCFISVVMFITQMLSPFVHKQRHIFRQRMRERYVIRKPKQFLSWSNRLSLLEIKHFSRILDGNHLIDKLDGVLAAR